jgi:hypothetical protein
MSSSAAKELQDSSLDEEKNVEALWDVPKPRRCLRCEESFQSAWSGERICPRCKKSEAWRRGDPAPATPQRHRR